MRKTILSLIAFFLMSGSYGFAAPINTVDQGQMSLGIVGGNVTDCYYLENKVSNNVTIGIQSINSDVDFYGEIDMSNGFNSDGGGPRLIVGSRNFNNSGSTTYAGVGVVVPLADGLNGYSSVIAGSGLQEFQLGAISKMSDSVSINFNYRNVRHNGTQNGVGIGLDCRI